MNDHRRTHRWIVAWGAAVGVFLLLGLPNWYNQVDDVFITLGFSRTWWETGVLGWTNGAIVEGYSNALWMVVGMIPIAIGVDPSVFLQAISVACVVAILALVTPRRPDPVGVFALLGLAVSDPLTYWGAMGMESAAYTLSLAVGWRSLSEKNYNWLGLSAFVISALLRTEGLIHLLISLLIWWRSGKRQTHLQVYTCVVFLLVYHSLRVIWFDSVLPAPTMVKALDGHSIWSGLRQSGVDLATWLGVLVVLLLSRRGHGWKPLLVSITPALIQCLVLIQIGGDWMGHGRLTWPGMACSIAVLAKLTPHEGSIVVRRWKPVMVGAALFAVAGMLLSSPVGDAGRLDKRPIWRVYAPGVTRLDVLTTLKSDLAYLVPRIPPGKSIYSTDIGMVGHIPGVGVSDLTGLTDPDTARVRAYNDTDARGRRLERLTNPEHGSVCIRTVMWGGGEPPLLQSPLAEIYRHCDGLVDQWSSIRYCCRDELGEDASLAISRWADLSETFPAQGWLKWQWALLEANEGQLERAYQIMDEAIRTAPRSSWALLGRQSLDFRPVIGWTDISPELGAELPQSGALVSRPIGGDELRSYSLLLTAKHVHVDGIVVRVRTKEGSLVSSVFLHGKELRPEHRLDFGTTLVPSMFATAAGEFRIEIEFAHEEGGNRSLTSSGGRVYALLWRSETGR